MWVILLTRYINILTGNDNVVTIVLKEDVMEKTATLNLRINPTLKKEAEEILGKLGIPMSTAIDMYLNQIVLVGGIPFSVTIPKMPKSIDVSQMSEEEFHKKLRKGYDDYLNGNYKDANVVFENLLGSHKQN